MSWIASMGRAVDQTIKIFSPARALRREQARARIDMLGAYRGAERNRFREHWLPGADSADAALLRDLPTLRERSRDLVRNDGNASGILDTIQVNTVGTGILPQSRPDVEDFGVPKETIEEFSRQAERVWRRWTPQADAQDRTTFTEMQGLIERQICENGDVLVLPMRIDEPHRFLPLALEVIEADRLQTPPDQRGNPRIRSGVELGDRGQPVAYWVNTEHPGDSLLTRSRTTPAFRRYPARNPRTGERQAFHLYWTKRPRQTRGVPLFAPILSYFKDLADYLEAELVAARIQACFALIFESTNPLGMNMGPGGQSATGQRLEEVEPGLVWYANQGETAKMVQPQRPGNTFEPFVDKILLMIGSALGLPRELVTKDFSKTNYSGARAALLEARRFFKSRQQFIAQRFCQPVWDMVQTEAWMQGELPGANLFAKEGSLWLRAVWIAPGWGWVDPVKEVNASRDAIKYGLSSLADECAALGGKDWEETAAENKREQDYYDQHDIRGGPWQDDTGAALAALPPNQQPQPDQPDGGDGEGDAEEPANPAATTKDDGLARRGDGAGPALFSDAQTNGHCVGA